MAKVIGGLYYSESHESVKVEDNIVSIGITDYAQQASGNIVYVDLLDVDDKLETGDDFGVVGNVRTTSDPSTPVSGAVVEVNGALEGTPELINQGAFGAWIIEAELSDTSELDNLMDAKKYEEFCNK